MKWQPVLVDEARMMMAETSCRMLLRQMSDRPIRMNVLVTPHTREFTRTPAADNRIMDQWVVNLSVNPDFVTVTAQTRYYFGMWDLIDVGGVNHIGPQYNYIRYPDSMDGDAWTQYTDTLREAVLVALQAVEADYAAKGGTR